MNATPPLSKAKTTRLAVVLLVVLISTGCIPKALEDEIIFHPDGSGTARTTLSVPRRDLQGAGIPPERLTQDLRRALPQGVHLDTRQDDTWLHWDVTFSFRQPAQLRETLNHVLGAMTGGVGGVAIATLTLASDPGFFRTTFRYSAELRSEFKGDAAMLAPYFRGWTHTVVLPGEVGETNGAVAGNRISWKLGANETTVAAATTTVTNPLAYVIAGVLGLVVVGLAGGGIVMWTRRRRTCAHQWCDQCGAAVSGGARFCDGCGAAASR